MLCFTFQAQKIRDQRRRKMAYYSGGNANTPDQGGGASSDTTATPKTVSFSLLSLSLSLFPPLFKETKVKIDLCGVAVDAVSL